MEQSKGEPVLEGMGRTKGRTHLRAAVTILGSLSLVGTLAAPSGAYLRPGTTEHVSVRLPNTPSVFNGTTGKPSTSDDGRYIAFESEASNIVLGDAAYTDIFLRDRRAKTIEIISKSPNGTAGIPPPDEIRSITTAGASEAMLSADGKHVVYQSNYVNLVPGDTNMLWDVFAFDVAAGKTERVSVDSKGRQATEQQGEHPWMTLTDGSLEPAVSSTGRYVVFSSVMSDLVEGDTNGASDVFLHDRKKHSTSRLSVSSKGDEGIDSGPPNDGTAVQAGSQDPTISPTGRFVTFFSHADNMVEDDTNNGLDAFLHDTTTGKTKRVSIASDGEEIRLGNEPNLAGGGARYVSRNGRYIIFSSVSSEVVPSDRENRSTAISQFISSDTDVFWRDLETGRTQRVSISSTGEEPTEGDSWKTSLSDDGRYIFFTSDAKNLSDYDVDTSPFDLVGDDDNDVFVHDVVTGATQLMSVLPGERTLHGAHSLGNSSSGRFVVFGTSVPSSVVGIPFSGTEVFIHDQGKDLGIGGLIAGIGQEPQPSDEVCVTPDVCVPRVCIQLVCVPPGTAVSSNDPSPDASELLTEQGADLYGASLAYRPQYGDLFAAIELEYMPKVLPGVSPIIHGLRFTVEDKSYEVRAASLRGGTFGLFDCSAAPLCTKVADLRGGYGTTGMRVVVSLPLDEIGLEGGGKLSELEAFSALGTLHTGAAEILDTVKLK